MNVLYTRGVCHKGERDLLMNFVEYEAVILSHHLGQQSTLHFCHQYLNLIANYFGFSERHLGNFPEQACERVTYEAVTPYSPAEI